MQHVEGFGKCGDCAGALDRYVCAAVGHAHHDFHQIFLHLVYAALYAHLFGDAESRLVDGEAGQNNGCADCYRHLSDHQTDGACAEDHYGLASLYVADLHDGVGGAGQRLGDRCAAQGYVVGQLPDSVFLHGHIFFKGAVLVSADADTVAAQVVFLLLAVTAGAAGLVGGFAGDPVTDLEFGHTFADRGDDAGQLVA